jgi:alpha-galactosidase
MPHIRSFRVFSLLLISCLPIVSLAAKQPLAAPQAPPMGWNSWDAYGLTIDEAQFRENVKVLASIEQFGWQYAVIDEGWYMRDPFAPTTAEQKYL